jgi:hypothetical protein
VRPSWAGTPRAHKVIATEVVKATGDTYGVIFTYDDGTEDFAEVGSKRETAEFYARVQMEETFPVGIHPLLLNAAKADELRQKNPR